ncbi:MAG: hypothetical protein E7597_04965 [Ruminococcaceae bacterium]|nr:hypothetical protein [Oscillospiraceae bacterium]
MKQFYRVLAFILCFALFAACLTACGNNESNDKDNTESIPAITNSSDGESGGKEESEANAVTTDLKYIDYTGYDYNYLFNIVSPDGKPLNEDDVYKAISVLEFSGLNAKAVDENLLYVGTNFDEELFGDNTTPSASAITDCVNALLNDFKDKTLSFKNSDGEVVMDYTAVKEAFFSYTIDDGGTTKPVVQIALTDEGAKLFAEITDEISNKADGENYIAVYLGEELISRPTVEEKIIDGSVIIYAPSFEENQEEAEFLASCINLGTRLDLKFKLKFYKEIKIEADKINEFKSAVAEAMSQQFHTPFEASDINKDLLFVFDSFIYTVYEDRSELEEGDDRTGPYRPAVILGTSEFTEYYIKQTYCTDLLTEEDNSYEEETEIPDHLVVYYELSDINTLLLFSDLEVLQLSGYTTGNMYSYYKYYYEIYELYGYKDEDNPCYLPYNSLSALVDVNDMPSITSLDQIPDLDKIKYLSLGYSGIDSLDGIEKAASLEYLEAAGCGLKDIKALEGVSTLKRINVAYNELTSLEGIENNKNLVVVNADNNKINSLKTLENAKKLTELYASSNALASLDGFGQHKELKKLYLSDNEALTDISLFAELFDADTLESCSFSMTDADDGRNTVITDWSSILTFGNTSFTGIPEEVQNEIDKIK